MMAGVAKDEEIMGRIRQRRTQIAAAEGYSDPATREARLEELRRANEEDIKLLQQRAQLERDLATAESTAPGPVPGSQARTEVKKYLDEWQSGLDKINRQRQLGMSQEDALQAKIKLGQGILANARKQLADKPGPFDILRREFGGTLGSRQAELSGYESQLETIRNADREKTKAEAAAREAKRKAEQQYKQDLQASLKQDEPFLQQVSDAADLLGEMQKRTERLKLTEEERFRLRVEAMATERPYLREELEAGLKALEVEEKRVATLKERDKLLQDAATASAARLTDLDRLQAQLAPRRRGETTEERLTRTYTELSNAPGVTMGRLSQASEQIRETLDTERWQKWSDFATESLDKVGDAITQFAFHGKLTFKDMVSSIAEDFFRMSLKMLTESAFSSAGGGGKGGGWLDLALKAGTSLLSAFSGTPTSGTLPTTEAAYAAQAAAGRFSGRQGGGTVLAGGPYWVGEAGPELVVPKQTSTVIPHGQSEREMVVHHHWHITTPDANSFVHSRGAVQRMVAGTVSQAYRGL